MLNISSLYYQEDLKQIASYIPPSETPRSVLITGASGLIGSLLVDAFLWNNNNNGGNDTVYALSRTEKKLTERFRYAENDSHLVILAKDITKPLDDDKTFDYIVHAASNADPGTYALYPVETVQTNIIGTTNVLEYAVHHPGTRVLFTSTMEVYGTMPDGTSSTEDMYGLIDFNSIRSGYPESKRVSEILCRSYVEEYGADALVTRLGYIYGPTMTDSDNKVVAQFIRKAINKENIVLKSKGEQRRSYCYASDTVSGIVCALFCGEKGQAYNVSNRDSVITIAEMAQVAAKIAGTSVEFDLPSEIEIKGSSKSQDAVLDEGKLRELGWAPKYSFEEGVSRTVKILS